MKSVCSALLLGALLVMTTTARASLIGDTITIAHHSPTLAAAPESTLDVLVENGTADAVLFMSGWLTVNPDASSVRFGSLIPQFSTLGFGKLNVDDSFNGFVVSGINDILTGFSISTNLDGWDNSRFSLFEHGFAANFELLSWRPESYLQVDLVTRSASVPDSGLSLTLIAATLIGLATIARRFATV